MDALKEAYPEFQWNPSLFEGTLTLEFQRAFFDGLAKEHGITNPGDLVSIPKKDIIQKGGKRILHMYEDLTTAIQTIYNITETAPERKGRKEIGYWTTERQKHIIERIGTQLGVKELDDWKKVSSENFVSQGGRAIMRIHNGSLMRALSTIYPHHRWNKDFEGLDDKYAIDIISKELGIKNMDDWYEISMAQLHKIRGASKVVQKYGTIAQAVMTLIPDYPWKPFKFRKIPPKFWESLDNQKMFLEYIAEDIGVKQLDDWNNVYRRQILVRGGDGLLRQHNYSLSKALQAVYPEHNWNLGHEKTSRGQDTLSEALKSIWPDKKPLLNYKDSGLTHVESKRRLEFDIYFPEWKLAFEFQGIQHYQPSFRGEYHTQLKRDQEKSALCKEHNVTLINIPYWWDRTVSSLQATIYQYRPELVKETELAKPIPSHPQIIEAARTKLVEDPSADFIKMDTYNEFIDPVGKIITEYFEGERAIWNPSTKCFIAGRKTKLTPPDWFLPQLPDIYLDGTLWLEYGQKIEANQIEGKPALWKRIKFMVHDSPDPLLNKKSFAERQASISSSIGRQNNLELVPYHNCPSPEFFYDLLEGILGRGGEGVLLHEPDLPYLPDVFSVMWVLKTPKYDHARIVESPDNQVWCMNQTGITFPLKGAMPDKLNIQIGTTILYAYYGINQNLFPVFPKLHEITPIQWSNLSPYVISTSARTSPVEGKKSGSFAVSCRVCYEAIPANNLRVKVNSIYQHDNKLNRLVMLSFCLKKECLQNQQQHKTRQSRKHTYPDFDGKLTLRKKKEELTEHESKQLEAFVNNSKDQITVLSL